MFEELFEENAIIYPFIGQARAIFRNTVIA